MGKGQTVNASLVIRKEKSEGEVQVEVKISIKYFYVKFTGENFHKSVK